MCSIGEDDFGDDGAAHAMIPESTATGTVLGSGCCNKCGLDSDTVYKLNFRAAECRECFLSYARHKFRAALGAAKVLPRNAEVLLLVDGSAESLVLLDMLHYAQTQNTFKRLHCNARVLYVDEGAVRHLQPLESEAMLKTLCELQCRYLPFEFHVVELGAGALQKLADYGPATSFETNELVSKLSKLRSLTARQDYLQQQRKRLIAAAAQQLGCAYVFESSISTQLATQLLTAIALGRGGSAAWDVALVDDRLPGGVQLLRPLKDLNEQEVLLYTRAQQLKPSVQQSGVPEAPNASLQNLTRAFVANLQQNYASTVSTVFRTGAKIAPNCQLETSLNDVCTLCRSPLDSARSDTLLAIEFSRAVSENKAKLKDAAQLEAQAKQRLAAADALCHACQNIQAEFVDAIKL